MSTSSQSMKFTGELLQPRSSFYSANSILKIVLLIMGMVIFAMGVIHFVLAQGGLL